jgi:hypothetical protein
VQLFVWYSDTHTNNFVAPEGVTPPDSSYKKTFPNGFTLSQPPSGNTSDGLPLVIYLNHDTSHTITTASDAEKTWAVANGYTMWKQVRWQLFNHLRCDCSPRTNTCARLIFVCCRARTLCVTEVESTFCRCVM